MRDTMFNKEFFPTPINVLDLMGIDCLNKTVLEPSAGKGDIVNYLYANGAKKVLAVELNDDLRKIVESKTTVIGSDFFDVRPQDVAHVDLIVMNPPFSNADKHILHAWEVAPDGCEIVTLCNYETINNQYTSTRKQLGALINGYGMASNLGDMFTEAERKTGVDIGLIKLFKPSYANNTGSFDDILSEEEEPEEDYQGEGLIPFNEIKHLVNVHNGAMKVFDKLKENMDELAYTVSALKMSKFALSVSYGEQLTTKEDFQKHLQKKAWGYLINKIGLDRIVTSETQRDVNRFIEQNEDKPFTVKNINLMIDVIIQTAGQVMDRSLVSVMEVLTKHTHENRFEVEGWKTNSAYMLNKKFIVKGVAQESIVSDLNIGGIGNYGAERLNDLTKVMCFLTGVKYNHDMSFTYMRNRAEGENCNTFKANTWYDFHEFFRFKVFKKGTMHLEFKDEYHWYLLNQRFGKLNGFNLPEKTNVKKNKK